MSKESAKANYDSKVARVKAWRWWLLTRDILLVVGTILFYIALSLYLIYR